MTWRHWVGGLLAVVALGVAWYAISPIFMTTRLEEVSPTAAQVVSEKASVVGTVGHPAEGSAHIVESEGKHYLRYQDFKTLNGPDLFVYLAKDLDAKEFVDLGRLRATEGDVNYEIPAGVDPAEYPYALVWCKAFSVLFNSAKVY